MNIKIKGLRNLRFVNGRLQRRCVGSTKTGLASRGLLEKGKAGASSRTPYAVTYKGKYIILYRNVNRKNSPKSLLKCLFLAGRGEYIGIRKDSIAHSSRRAYRAP